MAPPSSIFISYSSKDVKIAEAIENHLIKNGFDNIWRDKSKIRSDWSREIANALSQSDIVLLIWSENSSGSNWVKNEWLTARALDKPIKIVIISDLKKVPLPKPLANIESIVLENKQELENFNLQKISDFIKDTILSLSQIKYEYNILPDKRHIPFDLNPNFIGRNKELIELYLTIIGGLSKLNYSIVGITGIGGVGKTQLAVEFFYRYAYAFDKGIFWIDGTDPTKWLENIVSIARDHLKLEIENNPTMMEKDKDNNINKQYFNAFQNYCKQYGSKMLLLIDNVINPLQIYDDNILFLDPTTKFTILTLGCNILFSTRRDFKRELPANVIQHEPNVIA